MFDNPSKPKSIFDKHEEVDRWRQLQRRHGWLAASCGILALAVAGAAWYAYPKLKHHDASLSQSAGIKKAVDALGGRVEQQKASLAESKSSQDQLRDQLAELRREFRARIETAKKQANQTAEELFQRVQKQMAGEVDGVKNRTARLELSRDADQALIAELEKELGEVRTEVTSQNAELGAVRRQISETEFGTEQRLAALQAGSERSQQDVDAINGKLALRRIDFEVAKGHNQELAPGISLEITGTDVAYRRVTGWMWVLPDRRTIWLREQGSQEPVTFYGMNDGKKRELVITSVTKSSAVGYLLLPKGPNLAESAGGAGIRPADTLSKGSNRPEGRLAVSASE